MENVIHLVLGKADPRRMNGVNRVVHYLASSQAEIGENVEVWGLANSLDHNYPTRPFTTRLFPQHKNFQIDTSLIDAIKKLASNTVVHFHGAFIPAFYRVAGLLKKKQIPFVLTPHGAYAKGAMEKKYAFKRSYIQLFENFILKNALCIQALSEEERDAVAQFSPKAKVQIIPNGQMIFDDLEGLPPVRANEGLVFGFCGRLDIRHKGLDILLEAFAKFIENGHKGKLELIGDGADRPKLEQMAEKLKIKEHTIFHGSQFGEDKFSLLKKMHAFVHPSRMEGFPTAVLEAAALGKPCITSNQTNINGYIKAYNAGLPLIENTADTLFRAMEYVVSLLPLGILQLKGHNARRMIVEEFTWSGIANQIGQMYRA